MRNIESCQNPFESFLLIQGFETLSLLGKRKLLKFVTLIYSKSSAKQVHNQKREKQESPSLRFRQKVHRQAENTLELIKRRCPMGDANVGAALIDALQLAR
ncbi:hypothetical protein RhiirA5_439298 [Rhizophagus irregularis]|uniref:Uncharacterized protein n=1 Tax=Rhizophagus irregularis TaxID=588596 RepID=A0A2N0NI31_9GLOM|nr:hypothetical protein RhiirA5_439298 [Rhizophagus irregularis]